MKDYQNKTQKIVSTLVSKMIDRDTYEWPPKCTFVTYQPKRPIHVPDDAVMKNVSK